MIFKAISSQYYCLHANNPYHALFNGMCINTTKNTAAKALLRNFCPSVLLIILVPFIQTTKQESQAHALGLHRDRLCSIWIGKKKKFKKIETVTDMHTRQKSKREKDLFSPKSSLEIQYSHSALSNQPHTAFHQTSITSGNPQHTPCKKKKLPPQKPTCSHTVWA